MTTEQENARLREHLDYAVLVIEQYGCDLRAAKGKGLLPPEYCQGEFYRAAEAWLERRLSAGIERRASPPDAVRGG